MNNFLNIRHSLLKAFFRNAFIMTLILLPALFSPACTDDLKISPDESVPGAQENLGGGTKLYAYIRLLPVEDIYTRDDNNITDDQYGPGNQYDADFEAGKDAESKISNFLIIFYDQNGDYLAHYTSDSLSKKENKTELKNDPDLSKDEEAEPEEGVIEKIGWNVLLPVDIAINDPEFEEWIDAINSYFVIVNYDDDLLTADSEGNLSGKLVDSNPQRKNRLKKLEETNNDIKSISVQTYQYKDKNGDKTKDKGFLMTTAGRFDKDGKYWYYDPKPEDNDVLFKSKQEAQNNAITVYVERLAAKVDFKINKIEKIDVLYDETDVYSLVFNPISWGLEATEESGWLNKNIFDVNTKSAFGTQKYNYPSDFGDWSDYYNNRVFWATSYKFRNELSYPVKGNEAIDEYSYLSYQTFGEIIDGKAPGNGNIKSEENGKYVSTEKLYLLEHTFKDTELTRAINPYAVPTSVVLCGQYTIEKADPSTDKEKPDGSPDGSAAKDLDKEILKKGFYMRYVDMERTDYPVEGGNNGERKQYQYHIYLCDDVAEIDETNEKIGKPVGYKPSEELLNAMLKEQFMIWEPVRDDKGNIIKDEKGEIVSYQPVRDDKNGLLAIINTYTRHDITDGKWIDASNTYTLQLTSAGSDLYYKTSGDDSFHPITGSNLSTANQALQKQLGYAQYYWRGYAFFYAPILHYAGNEDPFKTGYKGLFNYDKNTDGSYKKNTNGNYIPLHKTGDFGVVRNTIYDFSIQTIKGLGYGIPGEDIIPLPEPRLEHEIYYFDLELKILPWNQFNYTFDI